jgi:hypothetical protein
MKQLLSFLLCLASITVSAQTKKIAFKSHSGSAENFSLALANDLFDMENSNFGVAPTELVQHAKLDSVIFVCDTLALMVTSQYCTRVLRHSKVQQGNTTVWKPGKTEVINHPLFSKQHSLDSIRQVISTQYNFKNPADKVVFVGYDNNKDSIKKNKKVTDLVRGGTGIPVSSGPPADKTGLGIFAGILAFSFAGGLIAWIRYRQQERKIKELAWAAV